MCSGLNVWLALRLVLFFLAVDRLDDDVFWVCVTGSVCSISVGFSICAPGFVWSCLNWEKYRWQNVDC